MAIGDVTLVELQKALSATPGDSKITNAGASYQTIISYLTLTFATAATTKRTIKVFKNGVAAANEIMTLEIDPTGNNAPQTVILDSQAIVLTGTQYIAFAQDTGTDINVYVSGIQEQIA